MHYLPEIDALVRGVIPGVLDIAGLRPQAESLRKLKPITTLELLNNAGEALSWINSTDTEERWKSLLDEITFWSFALMASASQNDGDMFEFCTIKIQNVISDGFKPFTIH